MTTTPFQAAMGAGVLLLTAAAGAHAGITFIGAQANTSKVSVYRDNRPGAPLAEFFAYDPLFRGGITVTSADFNGDGVPDLITAPGSGAAPVKVIDGKRFNQVDGNGVIADSALLGSFFAYDPGFAGGIRVAAGDINHDGTLDIITGAGPGGGPHVRVFDGRVTAAIGSNLLADFMATGFSGGIFVAAGDVDGDRRADIIVSADSGGSSPVQVYSSVIGAATPPIPRVEFEPFAGFTGGVRVAVGDISGDGIADIITAAGPGSGPHVRVFSGVTGQMLREYQNFDPRYTGGVFVAAGDVNGDGFSDILTGAAGGQAPVHVIDGRRPSSFVPLSDRDYLVTLPGSIQGSAVAWGAFDVPAPPALALLAAFSGLLLTRRRRRATH